MAFSLEGKLVVGLSSRALFDLEAADEVFRRDGLAAYRDFQREHENDTLAPGAAFRLVRALLSLNSRSADRLVEIIVMSRNDADSAMRVFNSIEAHGLDISRGCFRGGRDPWPYLGAFDCSLFLSADPDDVYTALAQGFPAALVLDPPLSDDEDDGGEVRVAFDGDAVLFDGGSEAIFQRLGLDAFHENEVRRADEPLSPGPFRPFLEALAKIQARFPEGRSPIRTALVTARAAPAHRRVVNTLRAWDVSVDETYFLGGLDKTAVLKVLRPHVFFDDQMTHLERAAASVPSARVLSSVYQLDLFPRASLGQPSTPPAGRVEVPPRPTTPDGATSNGEQIPAAGPATADAAPTPARRSGASARR